MMVYKGNYLILLDKDERKLIRSELNFITRNVSNCNIADHYNESVTIQMKATEQYVLLCCTRWLEHLSLDGMLILTVQRKATEQYFPVVLFIMLHKVILTFDRVFG